MRPRQNVIKNLEQDIFTALSISSGVGLGGKLGKGIASLTKGARLKIHKFSGTKPKFRPTEMTPLIPKGERGIDYKSIRKSNLANLRAKQYWQVSTPPWEETYSEMD